MSDTPQTMGPRPAADEYECSACGGVFLKGRSDEEAAMERDHLFPWLGEGGGCLVCDDCFKAMGFMLVIEGTATDAE